MSKIDSLRKELDVLNTDLISLLEKRFEILDEVAQFKKEQSLDLYDPVREGQMLQEIQERLNSHPASPYIMNAFKALLSEGLQYMNHR